MKISDIQKKKRVLALALFAGEIMLKNGAETSRVEDTIRRICMSRGFDSIYSFVTPTVIMIGDDRNDGYTFIKRIDRLSTDFNRVAMVNSLSREFVEGKKDIHQMDTELRKVSNAFNYSQTTRIIACAVASSMFAYLFGGDISDMLCGFFISLIVTKIEIELAEWDVHSFLSVAICSIISAVSALILYTLKLGTNLDMIIVAAIMQLLPGGALTNGIKDFIAGDLMSGLSRAYEALLIAVAIAVSIGSVLSVIAKLGGF